MNFEIYSNAGEDKNLDIELDIIKSKPMLSPQTKQVSFNQSSNSITSDFGLETRELNNEPDSASVSNIEQLRHILNYNLNFM